MVASFVDNINHTFELISPMIKVPPLLTPIYFCFYEFFAIDGARLAMCTDYARMSCFYSITELSDKQTITVRFLLIIIFK